MHVKTNVVLSPAVLTDLDISSEARLQQVHPRNINGKKNCRLNLSMSIQS